MTSASATAATPTHWHNQAEPKLIDKREQVLDPMTAYQITSMMQGVIQRGTGVAIKALGRTYIAGKTGTTNEAKDVWFVGFSADLAVGVYIGFDKPRSLGDGENAQAATYAAPIFSDFMRMALEGQAGHALPRAGGHQAASASAWRPACAPTRAMPAR